jgi:hypothetical protein
MEVHIQNVIATVRAVSSDAVLTPKTMDTIVTTVMGAWRAEQEQQARLIAERRLSSSAHSDGEGEV